MGIVRGFQYPLSCRESQIVFLDHRDLDVVKTVQQFFTGIDQGGHMGGSGVTTEQNDITQPLGIEGGNQIQHQHFQGAGGNADGTRMLRR